jgi:plasmid stability protein
MRRTTVRIDDELLADAKAFAARHGRSLNSVVEDALHQMLRRTREAGERTHVDLPVSGGGGLVSRWAPGADVKEIGRELDIEDYVTQQQDRGDAAS